MALDQNKNVGRGEIVLTYVALLVLCVIAVAVGLYSWIFSVFIPALLAYTFVRAGVKHVLLQSGLVVILFSFIQDGFYEPVLTPLFSGLAVGFCVRRKKTILHTVSVATILLLAAEVILYFSDAFRADSQLYFAQHFAEQSTQVIQELGYGAKESAMLIEMFQVYTPAIFLLTLATSAYGIIFFLRLALHQKAPEIAAIYPRFRDLYVPKSCVFVWILAWIISLVGDGPFAVAMANTAVVLSSYIIVCGFAIVLFRILRVRSIYLRIFLILTLLWLFSFITPIAFVIGTLDMTFHFRTRKRGDGK